MTSALTGEHGELTGDQRSGGERPDSDGGEVEAAAVFGLSTATRRRRVGRGRRHYGDHDGELPERRR
uniref:Uncharacterized protein n=1 Tax=Oryza meridionalis TaxID=40149 RepID=A0A0E0DC06_9ORYZ